MPGGNHRHKVKHGMIFPLKLKSAKSNLCGTHTKEVVFEGGVSVISYDKHGAVCSFWED